MFFCISIENVKLSQTCINKSVRFIIQPTLSLAQRENYWFVNGEDLFACCYLLCLHP